MKTTTLIFLSALCAASCSDFETLRVVGGSPENHERGVEIGVVAQIEFNNDVRRNEIEKSFFLRCDSQRISGSYQWVSDRQFRFVPRGEIKTGQRCTMEISRTVHDTKGNTMEEDFLSEFYTGTDTVRPVVSGTYPAKSLDGTVRLDIAPELITVDFSEPMDRLDTEKAFSLSPYVDGYILWENNDTRMVFHPVGRFEYARRYDIFIRDAAHDTAGNSLASSFTASFIIGNDFSLPEVIGIYDPGSAPPIYWSRDFVNENVSKMTGIAAAFSKSMDRISAENAFSISPPARGSFRWNASSTTMTFIPESGLDSETVYTIRIAGSCADAKGMRISEPYDLSIKTNGIGSGHIRVAAIDGSCNDGNGGYAYMPLYRDGTPLAWPLTINMGEMPPSQTSPRDYFFRITFRNDFGPAAINPLTVIGNIRCVGFGGVAPLLSDIRWNCEHTEFTVAFDMLANDIIPPDMEPVLYRITIDGGDAGIRDANGNTMLRDFVFECIDSQRD